ncbi:MAG: phosphoribosyltransferase [Candidatus Hydrogenedentes bacterium]|nr:phosphoribosyltransferase [Candidatus Hydrogenedentota bacterium]
MIDDRLIIGMPAGSLADASRGGNLVDLLRDSGFPTRGYDVGGPSTFPVNTCLMGWDGRPQEFGAQLGLGEIDLAIGGDDWIRERSLELKYEYKTEIRLEKVLSLQRGNVRVVVIRNPLKKSVKCDTWLGNLLKQKPLVTVVAEMPYLALEWFQTKAAALGYGKSHAGFSVQKFKTPPKIASGIVIYETWGKTEAKVTNGSVDFGFEITQTGSAIRNYGLDIVDEVMRSEAGIWVNPNIRKQPVKYDLARMVVLNLFGAMFAENKVLLLFNAKKDRTDALTAYLEKNRLFADEPTMNEGVNFTEFSVQMDACDPKLPIAQVRYELAKLGATHIETIPLESSIPGIGVVDF